MWQSVLIQRALPLTLSYLLLVAAAISLDYILHAARLAWIGRYLGVAGTAFLVFSFGYSARKKKLVRSGTLKFFLRLHCNAGWIGTLMVLVHSGIHFNAMLPWAATAFMMIVTASGHIGQYLVRKIREEVKMKKKQAGITENADDFPDQQHYWDSLTVSALDRWRTIHMPIVSVLLLLCMLHIFSVIFFLNWE
ncbi:MAG: hypothetical protein FJZ79_07330 [Chlorobi bacterium]|nr:hypothetical protein [Chlorobiota bacterium]